MRFNNLTAARFVAAFLVFLHHSTPAEYAAVQSKFWHNFFLNGYVGVTFFFILSGFVIAASSLERLRQPTVKAVASFYWNRLARIVPLWAVVSAPLVWSAYVNGNPALPWFLTFTQAWLRDINLAFSILAVSWTLSAEMFFYAVFPLIAALTSGVSERIKGPAFSLIGLGIGLAGALYFVQHPQAATLPWTDPDGSHYWLYRLPLSRVGEFLTGIGLFVMLQSGLLALSRKTVIAVLAIAIIALFEIMGRLPIGGAWWIFPYAPIFAVIIVALARLDQLGFTVTAPLPILLGEASFAFYLIHQYYGKLLLTTLLPLGLRMAQTATFIFTVSASVGLFLLIESPLRTRLVRLFHTRSTAPSPVIVDTTSN
ncbi:peptidoglycan/LPS O-acetylase OafA/YrhL [Luteibacter sp. HA06]|jgi:peptidoglycan/LPS O-acetylase OafA/YrhL